MPSETRRFGSVRPSTVRHAVLVLGLALPLPPSIAAQQATLVLDTLAAASHKVADIPFEPGEEMRFKLRASIFGGGKAHMTVGPVETLRGHETFPVVWQIQGSALGIGLSDKFYSWMDTETLVSRRFVKDQETLGRKRYREYDFYPEKRLVHRIDYDTTFALPTSLPLDDISFVYFARTLPLEVGETHTLNRFYKDDGNPVILNVLRKDSTEVPAGVFPTIVVQPIIRTSGLFGEGGEAEIHFSDDERRLVVYMRADLGALLPTLEMELESVVSGTSGKIGAGAGDPAATAGGASSRPAAKRTGAPR